jgi:hypothetical protein
LACITSCVDLDLIIIAEVRQCFASERCDEMTKTQFAALWNLKVLYELAYQKYKDYDYALRQRILQPDAMMVSDDYTYQNLLRKDEWYEKWQFKVEHHLSMFREFSPKLLLQFQNIDLGDWTDTIANRLEKQMIVIDDAIGAMLRETKVYDLRKTHFDTASKRLFIIQTNSQTSYKALEVDFSRAIKQAILLEEIYKNPREHHDVVDLEFKVDPSGKQSESDPRTVYYVAHNINRKINKVVKTKMDLLESRNDQVWVYHLHI